MLLLFAFISWIKDFQARIGNVLLTIFKSWIPIVELFALSNKAFLNVIEFLDNLIAVYIDLGWYCCLSNFKMWMVGKKWDCFPCLQKRVNFSYRWKRSLFCLIIALPLSDKNSSCFNQLLKPSKGIERNTYMVFLTSLSLLGFLGAY